MIAFNRRQLLVILVGLKWVSDPLVAAPPALHDDRLKIGLFAEEPDIVTPIGMAIDANDRIFVIESHTHHPPKDYQGPKGDRVKVFEDTDNNGKPDRISIFAQDLHQGMNLAFSPEGVLFVVCSREVFAFPDTNGDGVCDQRVSVLTLETKQRYAHNCLLGITFDREGWMYLARGNVGSDAWAVRGKDGTEINGYGDGGNVIRCRPDGTQVSEMATGFWNPFNLKFTMQGKLLLVDNDPDARGPNRLLHVVAGGDYGHKSVYGGGGNHPFQGWDGSLPGTLPVISGTGEAPCDLIDCHRTHLPIDYHSSVLATIWNENTIERHALRNDGKTLGLKEKVLFLSGDKNFRPVALEADSRGNLFITDWVLVDYPNHGRGRIWRVRAKEGKTEPRGYFDYGEVDETTAEQLIGNLEEPRMRQLLNDRKAGNVVALPTYLADNDPKIKRGALVWAGELLDPQWRDSLDLSLKGRTSTPMFEAYLAAVENLSGTFAQDFKSKRTGKAKALKRSLDPSVLVGIMKHATYSNDIRARALKKLDLTHVQKERPWIEKQLKTTQGKLQLVAVRKMAQLNAESALLALAEDVNAETGARSEALLALATQPLSEPEVIAGLLHDREADVAIEAARTLRLHVGAPVVREAIQGRMATAKGELATQLAYALDPSKEARPSSLAEWKETLATGGNPDRGHRVFHTTQVMCARCHTVDGGAALLGPSLAGIAQSVSREQIIQSILKPSDQFPPQYQAWVVKTKDGVSHNGLQLDHQSGGAINMLGLDGKQLRFEAEDIADYEASPHSLMPEGLEALMPISDLRNLVAFLVSLN